MDIAIITSTVGIFFSYQAHKYRVARILKIENPEELRKKKYMRMSYLSFFFLFWAVMITSIYVIATYPNIPFTFTNFFMRKNVLYTTASLPLDVIDYLVLCCSSHFSLTEQFILTLILSTSFEGSVKLHLV